MHIALLGATGQTGKHVVTLALEQSHQLHLLVRDPSKLSSEIRSHPNVHIVKGDVKSKAEIKEIVHASDVTMICVGASENVPTTVHRDATQSVLEAMSTKTGPKKIVIVTSGFCHPEAEKHTPWFIAKILDFFLGEIKKDHKAATDLLRASKDVEWVALEPPQVVEGPKVGFILSENHVQGAPMVITFRDLAESMLEVAQSNKVKKDVLITSKQNFKVTKEMNAQSRELMMKAVKTKIVRPVLNALLFLGVVAVGVVFFRSLQ